MIPSRKTDTFKYTDSDNQCRFTLRPITGDLEVEYYDLISVFSEVREDTKNDDSLSEDERQNKGFSMMKKILKERDEAGVTAREKLNAIIDACVVKCEELSTGKEIDFSKEEEAPSECFPEINHKMELFGAISDRTELSEEEKKKS